MRESSPDDYSYNFCAINFENKIIANSSCYKDNQYSGNLFLFDPNNGKEKQLGSYNGGEQRSLTAAVSPDNSMALICSTVEGIRLIHLDIVADLMQLPVSDTVQLFEKCFFSSDSKYFFIPFAFYSNNSLLWKWQIYRTEDLKLIREIAYGQIVYDANSELIAVNINNAVLLLNIQDANDANV